MSMSNSAFPHVGDLNQWSKTLCVAAGRGNTGAVELLLGKEGIDVNQEHNSLHLKT